MTGHAIGIADSFRKHRLRCEQILTRLSQREPVPSRCWNDLAQDGGRELVNLVREAASLQDPAQKKLSSNRENSSPQDPTSANSPTWWVTDKSLQQATPWQVARYKASWFGDAPVHDLCCGIGGDSIQLAARGEVIAVERDPLLAAMAEANLNQAPDATRANRVHCADVVRFGLAAGVSLHLDPDRRPQKYRTSDPSSFAPSWDYVTRLVAQAAAAVIKLAPASEIPQGELPNSEFHRCWIALSGSVREQSLLWGEAIDRAGLTKGTRSALLIGADGRASWFAPETHSDLPAVPHPVTVRSMLVDPHAAIRAAGLTESFAQRHRLGMIAGPAGFLVGDPSEIAGDAPLSQLAAIGEVLWWGACDDRKLRQEFRRRNVFPETIKVRGTGHDPASLVKRYRKCGEQPVRLWIGRDGQRVFAAITE